MSETSTSAVVAPNAFEMLTASITGTAPGGTGAIARRATGRSPEPLPEGPGVAVTPQLRDGAARGAALLLLRRRIAASAAALPRR